MLALSWTMWPEFHAHGCSWWERGSGKVKENHGLFYRCMPCLAVPPSSCRPTFCHTWASSLSVLLIQLWLEKLREIPLFLSRRVDEMGLSYIHTLQTSWRCCPAVQARISHDKWARPLSWGGRKTPSQQVVRAGPSVRGLSPNRKLKWPNLTY